MLYSKPNIFMLEYNEDLSKMIYNIETGIFLDSDSAIIKKLSGIIDLKRWRYEFNKLYQDNKLYNSKIILDMNNKPNRKIFDAVIKFNQMNQENKILYFLDDISVEFAFHFRNLAIYESSPFLFDLEYFIFPD